MFCAIRRCSSRAISFVCLIPAEFTAISGDFNPFFDFAINIQLQNSTMIGGQPQRIYWRQKIKIESQRRWSTNDAFVTANCSKKFATNPDINRLPSERILCLPSCYLIIQPIHPADPSSRCFHQCTCRLPIKVHRKRTTAFLHFKPLQSSRNT